MFNEILLHDFITFIISVGMALSIVISVVIWFNKKYKRIERLESFVFDKDGNERYVTKSTHDITSEKILKRLDDVVNAVNFMSETFMVSIDAQIETCPEPSVKKRLIKLKEEHNKKRDIV